MSSIFQSAVGKKNNLKAMSSIFQSAVGKKKQFKSYEKYFSVVQLAKKLVLMTIVIVFQCAIFPKTYVYIDNYEYI